MHSLLLVNSHFFSFKKPLLAKDGHGLEMSLWLSVLSLSPGSSSSRGWGEGIGVNIGRTISNHLCGSGPTDWHHDWAGEVEETAPALSCCTWRTAGNLWRSLCDYEWIPANVSHLTVGAEHRQCISQHPTEWVSPALSLLSLTLLTLRPPTMVPPTVAGVGFQGCKEVVGILQWFSQIVAHRNRIDLA